LNEVVFTKDSVFEYKKNGIAEIIVKENRPPPVNTRVAHENKKLFVFSAEMKSLFHFMHARLRARVGFLKILDFLDQQALLACF